ncbi:MAG: carboxylesterase/lipase family protein [Vicinamibacterales bacterium]|nr:carboxylesterase/lipase family protein [Vicinamibacterales bacterium]
MASISSRRTFVKQAGLVLAGVHTAPLVNLVAAADTDVLAPTSAGRVRGTVVQGINVFKGIPYGGTTAGKNRFMPPTKPTPWTGTRDALAWGPTAPQTVGEVAGRPDDPPEREDCLVLNVFTPALGDGRKRPVMVWLHGGGFSTGSASRPIVDGTNLARSGDAVVVSINHRLNVFGFTYLGEALGSDFALSGGAGMLDIVAALQWVRDNIDRFGGDPNLVTIFGQSGGGRKVATLMSMPSAKGLFQRAIIESGAVLRLTTSADAFKYTSLLLSELGLKAGQVRELQNAPVARLLQANASVLDKLTERAPGWTANSPMVDGKAVPSHPWDPAAPALSSTIPLLIGYARTEETLYDRPTAEKLALDETGLKQRVAARLGIDPGRVIEAYRKAHPEATPWDLHILIATDHPRGTYAREMAKRKADQKAAPAFFYRFDWETPEGGGHMRSPHTIEIQFAFNNIEFGGPLISKRSDAHSLAEKVSAAWVAFARTGNPNVPQLPRWPAYSAGPRDTMLFNSESRVEQDPDREPRLVMEHVLGLS